MPDTSMEQRLLAMELNLTHHTEECSKTNERVGEAITKIGASLEKSADAMTAATLATTTSFARVHSRIDQSALASEGARKDLRIALMTVTIIALISVLGYAITTWSPLAPG